MQNRREIWRNFMGCFEPAADPRDAIRRGFYVSQPGRGLGDELATRFEVKPSASYLLVGGVGSGKTTQLLVARDKLEETGDVNATYVDVSLRLDPRNLWWGDLLPIVGLTLASGIGGFSKQSVDADIKHFESLFDSGGSWDNDDAIERVSDSIRHVQSKLTSRKPYVVVLIDALDRMTDLVKFREIASQAVPILRTLGIGVILAGPLTAIYGLGGTITDRFDRFHHLPTIDVHTDDEGRKFLREVLKVRDGAGLLTDEAADKLAALSGGVLRDLIALTQLAGEEAYVDGADRIDLHHVETAGDVFGRKQMAALDSAQMQSLQRVRTDGTFVETSEKDLALLSTRRVLEYPRGNPRFAVHPTIEQLLAQLASYG